MYCDIKQNIVKLLQDSELFEAVYDYEPAMLASFPCITVSARSSVSSDLATGTIMAPTQMETYTFSLRIYYGLSRADGQIDDEGRHIAESVILQKTDALIDLLARNRSLNGVCQKSRPISTVIGETQRELAVKYSETTLEVEVVTKRV